MRQDNNQKNKGQNGNARTAKSGNRTKSSGKGSTSGSRTSGSSNR